MQTPQTEHTSPDDARFMAVALALGRRGLGNTWPNPAVGAVVARPHNGAQLIVGRGWTQPGGRPHAEAEALRRAGASATGATLYTTLEPCSHHGRTPPCVDAIVAAGIARVVVGVVDPDVQVSGRGIEALEAAGIAVTIGVRADEVTEQLAPYLKHRRTGRPWVVLKM